MEVPAHIAQLNRIFAKFYMLVEFELGTLGYKSSTVLFGTCKQKW